MKNGYQMFSINYWQRRWHLWHYQREKHRQQNIINKIVAHPENGEYHFELAEFYFSHQRWMASMAECRTAISLGCKLPIVYEFLAQTYLMLSCSDLVQQLPIENKEKLVKKVKNPNNFDGRWHLLPSIYQRLKILSEWVNQTRREKPLKILDVGGGEGALALFLPNDDYVLVEPITNGLYAQTQLFPHKSFDIVVCCHVLEHIPEEEKEKFLTTLCSLAKEKVILLGPIATREESLLINRLMYDITKAPWAKEHLECHLPALSFLQNFAEKLHLGYQEIPNSHEAAVYWMIFAEYFARQAHKENEFWDIVHFANQHLTHQISSKEQPNDYLIEFTL